MTSIAAVLVALPFALVSGVPVVTTPTFAISAAMGFGAIYVVPIMVMTLWAAQRLSPATITFLLSAEILSGVISGALFLCVGVIYDRMHTREIDAYGGLVNRMPAYALIFMLFTMANVGLPGTSGFVGEFLTLMAVFQVNTWVAAVATTGVIFSAGYALWLYRRVVMGDLIKESLRSITDMTGRERLIFAPLVVMTLLLGVYPALVLDITGPAVAALVDNYDMAQSAADAALLHASK